MNKEKIILQLKELVKSNLEAAYTAAKNTYDIATHEENKAENKYDTRGLEASYLAGAQAERVSDIKQTLTLLETMQIKKFKDDSKIALSALIELQLDDKKSWVLLLPKGGGISLTYENQNIQVITPESPLGKNLIGKEVGDSVQIITSGKTREYEIISLG